VAVRRDDWQLLHYITKAEATTGSNSAADPYRKKRLLFKSGLGLNKYGTIGQFWITSKSSIWKQIQDREKRIAFGKKQPHVMELARHVFDFLEQPINELQLYQLERKFAYQWDAPWIQNWIQQVFRNENSPTPKSIV
jgi:hypothetical protein